MIAPRVTVVAACSGHKWTMSARRSSVVWLALIIALVASAWLLAACGGDGGGTTPDTVTGSGEASTSSSPTTGAQPSAGGVASCGLTVGTTEGPYYISGTQELKDGNVNYTGLSGDEVRVSGHVYAGEDTEAPVAGAKVEIWQADTEGHYHPQANGDASQYTADALALRGYVVSDGSGAYSFTTIYPGYYEGRTRHIHLRASAEAYGAIVTQLIVPAKEGDGTTPETDMIAQSLPTCNFIEFTGDAVPAGTFDFHLAPD
jgi:protocatechuate 3,4-dioxygenase beta subunit